MNNAAYVDVRKTMSGVNGALYDGDGNHIASIENFSSNATVNSTTFQPLGSTIEQSVPVGFKIALTFSEIIVHTSKFFKDFMDGLRTGKMPVYSFRGDVISPYDDSTEQVVYRGCVPDGSIDIQNMAVGELYKRNWSFVCNEPPELQGTFND